MKLRKFEERPLIILHGDIKTPPLSPAARVEAGMTQATPKEVIGVCKKRFRAYDNLTKGV